MPKSRSDSALIRKNFCNCLHTIDRHDNTGGACMHPGCGCLKFITVSDALKAGTGEPAVFVRKRRPRQPKQPQAGAAQREIDSRLAEALSERAIALKKVSALVYYQDRLTRLNKEIDSLLSYQQRLMGIVSPTVVNVEPTSTEELLAKVSATYSHTEPIPPGIGSIPTKRGPAPTPNGNAADVVGNEGGFN